MNYRLFYDSIYMRSRNQAPQSERQAWKSACRHVACHDWEAVLLYTINENSETI